MFHGAGLNVTVMSSNGKMHVGLIGCRDALPDIGDLAAEFGAELDALYDALERQFLAQVDALYAATVG